MKKSLATILSILLFSTSIFAGNPPRVIQKVFEQKFSNATNIKWAKENSKEWEAEFVLNAVKVSANFLNDGTWVETETEIPVAQLPYLVIAAIKKGYPTWEITGGDKIDTAKKGTRYEADIKSGMKKKEVELTEDGTFLQ